MKTVFHRQPVRAALALLAASIGLASAALAAPVAPAPPMGWNSWDAYGFTVDEAAFKANVRILAGMKSAGWSYAVIDEGWYMADPLGADVAARGYRLDAYGRLEPVVSRFPSAADGDGLKAIADWTHALGLKFGIHIVRGIPRAAVEANLPIAGSPFRAADAADRAATCPWDQGNYGVADNEAGQAWYDSLLREYAAWGVDFLKVDCIADHPYRPSEIAQIGRAIKAAGRPMVLSLSPGPARLANFAPMAKWAQMWRISDDLWDSWAFPHPDPATEFPNGILSAFDRLALWNKVAGPDRWPDADMLPFGSLRPHPGWGDPRDARLTEDETRTAFTLWAIARSPLILGGNLTGMPGWLRAMLTNRKVIALDQASRKDRPVAPVNAPAGVRIWVSGPMADGIDTVAIFNVSEAPLQVDVPWTSLGLEAGEFAACDLWTRAKVPASGQASVAVAPHGVALLRVGKGSALSACR
ncbi:MAG TPA: glycoside hydrolase family 27 protein [Allosphingosinicella sp.]|nr:glycoside hydrolase family 27 protein [Allosphingosinicella sp.]